MSDETEKKAKRELQKLAEEGGLLSSPQLKVTSKTVSDHFQAKDAPQDDQIEIWGTRIARALSLVVFIGLSIYLYITYF